MFKVIKDDILNFHGEAVIIPTTEVLTFITPGSKKIYEAAGQTNIDNHFIKINKKNYCDILMSNSFNCANVIKIFYVVLPYYNLVEEPISYLFRAYRNLFQTLKKENITNIGMELLGIGNYFYPSNMAYEVFTSALKDFENEMEWNFDVNLYFDDKTYSEIFNMNKNEGKPELKKHLVVHPEDVESILIETDSISMMYSRANTIDELNITRELISNKRTHPYSRDSMPYWEERMPKKFALLFDEVVNCFFDVLQDYEESGIITTDCGSYCIILKLKDNSQLKISGFGDIEYENLRKAIADCVPSYRECNRFIRPILSEERFFNKKEIKQSKIDCLVFTYDPDMGTGDEWFAISLSKKEIFTCENENNFKSSNEIIQAIFGDEALDIFKAKFDNLTDVNNTIGEVILNGTKYYYWNLFCRRIMLVKSPLSDELSLLGGLNPISRYENFQRFLLLRTDINTDIIFKYHFK